jgi:spermidine/putrescine transport system ATP-binding protein
MTAEVRLEEVTIRFGSFEAVKAVDLTIAPGEFFSILGPSGCGKTTLLRTIGGFVQPSEGRVRIGGRDVTGTGPDKRPTAMIFQTLALFPLMTVAENIGYGLRVRGVSRAERDRRVTDLLALVALPDVADRKVGELSGGQRQRIAIARALAVEPEILLLDEPLSALDLRLRQHMRTELRAIQRRVGITFLYITHDQSEALSMSDRIAVMNRGVVEQVGDGRSVYDEPATPFVAGFVGENNGFKGRVTALTETEAVLDTPLGPLRGRRGPRLETGSEAILFVRPESFRIADADEAFSAEVVSTEFEGHAVHLRCGTAGGHPVTVTLSRAHHAGAFDPGARLGLGYEPAQALVLAA